MTRDRADLVGLLHRHTVIDAIPLIPELRIRQANELTPIWEDSERLFGNHGPPYWAFAWAGGQALARYVLDHPELVAGRRVLSFAAGCGIEAVAAARAGADWVCANDIDPRALLALEENAALNSVTIALEGTDLLSDQGRRLEVLAPDVILAGDICYEQPLSDRVMAWLRARVTEGRLVLLGDPGRAFLPKRGVEVLRTYTIETSLEIEGSRVRHPAVLRVLAE